MLNIVLNRNIKAWQTWGASIGVFIGLLLLLFAMQVYLDVQILIHGAKDSNILVLNKKVTSAKERTFSLDEIEDMKKQSFFNQVETFESSNFEVWADIDRLGVSTLLFFQSVPNNFIGIDTSEFTWKEGDEVLPIIMANDYLTLYNFGFSSGQGLPKMSSDMISTVEFDVRVGNKNKSKVFKAYICGFTNNINSILVPKSFIKYANKEFGQLKSKAASQVAVSTDNPYNKNLEKYLVDHDLEISRGGLIGAELKSALYLMIFLVLMIGSIIIGLSLLVFVLNFQLLIAQSSSDIKLLMEIGFKHQKITSNLSKKLIVTFVIIVFLVFSILYPLKYFMTGPLIQQGFDKLSLVVHPMVVISGIAFSLIFILTNYVVIKSNVKKQA